VKGIKYIGPVFDHSGYGEASRNYVLALSRAGVPITLQPHCFEKNPPPVGSAADRQVLNSLVNKTVDFDIVIVHLTPDLAPAYAQQHPGKYVISYTVWETSKLHPLWAEACNQVNEIWVPCEWNVESFKNSGVTVPVHKIHHGIDTEMYNDLPKGPSVLGTSTSAYTFLSVMQWNYRKNPEGLLRSYFNAFSADDDVRLVLKAYIGGGHTPQKEAQMIKDVVKRIKTDMQITDFPRVSLITEQLPSDSLRCLYRDTDAYISLSHGEGFGLTMFEAGLAGKPVIATGKGGNMEYMNHENSYPVPAMWDYVYGMSTFNRWYLGDQQWARPDIVEAARIMRHIFDNRDEASQKGKLLSDRIKSEFSWDKVATQMLNRLKEL
jgi:glycosyltransferase involved in cell wall biosynthesis